ncbi:MAG: hypothetical protein J7L35_05295 [Anaerolineales bacterium]|nr:hypothetical protein [Anaerolineales bacterium]
MKMKTQMGLVLILVLFISACSSTGSQESTRVVLSNDYAEDALSVEMQLVVGSLILEESDQALNPELASSLVSYWKLYLSLAESDTAAVEEMDSVVSEIQALMTQDQVSYIAGLQLTQESLTTLLDDLGIIEQLSLEIIGTGDGTGERPEGIVPGSGSGGGAGAGVNMEGMDPELIATMQAEREEEGAESVRANRLLVPLIEQLILKLEGIAGS